MSLPRVFGTTPATKSPDVGGCWLVSTPRMAELFGIVVFRCSWKCVITRLDWKSGSSDYTDAEMKRSFDRGDRVAYLSHVTSLTSLNGVQGFRLSIADLDVKFILSMWYTDQEGARTTDFSWVHSKLARRGSGGANPAWISSEINPEPKLPVFFLTNKY